MSSTRNESRTKPWPKTTCRNAGSPWASSRSASHGASTSSTTPSRGYPFGPIRDDLLDRRPVSRADARGFKPFLITRIGVRGNPQPPQPQHVMQMPVLLGPSRASSRCVVVRQELLMKPGRQDTQDLDRVVRVVVIHGLRRHTTIIAHRRRIRGNTLRTAHLVHGQRHACRDDREHRARLGEQMWRRAEPRGRA